MDLYIKNPTLETIGIIDAYTSLIWATRYYTAGDFELYLPATTAALKLLQIGNYVTRLDDDRAMIIEKISITTDTENGNYLTVTGRSLESLLARRIVWNLTTYAGTAEEFIRKLVNDNAIASGERKIPGLILGDSQGYAETTQKQVLGDNLYDVIVETCMAYGYGWKIALQGESFVFGLFKGVDRSYNQTENPFVVFSPEFDNLINSNYEVDFTNYANVALVAGEGEGIDQKTNTAGEASGLGRYEIFVDAGSASTNAEEEITEAEYLAILQTNGFAALAEREILKTFEGEVEPTIYQYKTDWNIGDIVQAVNEYGIHAAPRILEVIENDDDSGYKVIPTLQEWGVPNIIPGHILIDANGYALKDSNGAILIVEE